MPNCPYCRLCALREISVASTRQKKIMRRKGPTSNFAIVFRVADDLFSLCLNMQLAYAKYRTLSPILRCITTNDAKAMPDKSLQCLQTLYPKYCAKLGFYRRISGDPASQV